MRRCSNVLVSTLLLLWVLVPQMACFWPDALMTQAESDCCRQMSGDCSEANMPDHACCKTVVRTDVAVAANVVRQAVPDFHVAITACTFEVMAEPSIRDGAAFLTRENHSPPPDPYSSPTVLRI